MKLPVTSSKQDREAQESDNNQLLCKSVHVLSSRWKFPFDLRLPCWRDCLGFKISQINTDHSKSCVRKLRTR